MSEAYSIDLGFTTEVVPDCHHICLIYDNEEQRRKIVSQYLAAGMKAGEIVRYFADTTDPDEIRAWLSEMGVELRDDDSFRIIPAENAYCPGGRFVPQVVIDNAVARYSMAREAGYSASRVTGDMSWVLRDIPGADQLLEYEVGLNGIHHDFPRVGMCQYDARRFDGSVLFKVLQVHPYMVAQGQIVRNPFFVKPEEFLREFKTE
ncbi:MAG: MEDS domain-containing protein [Chloroflexota bacterium]